MGIFNKTVQAPVKQTIESVQMDALKVSYRYKIAIWILVTAILAFIGGYFASITLINEAQGAVVNSIELSVKE